MKADDPVAVSMTAQNGVEETVRFGSAIRRAGWDQVPWVNGEWPPFSQMIMMRLTAAQWRFVADQARRRVERYESLGGDDSARLCRDALAALEAAGVAA